MRIRGYRDIEAECHWRAVLKDWDATGLNGAQYCRERGITYSQFRDWRIELRKRDAEVQELEQQSNDMSAVEENWRLLIAEWRRSELTAADYCRRKQIISYQFNNWKAKIDRIDAKHERAAQKVLARKRQLERADTRKKAAQVSADNDKHSVEFAEVKLTERNSYQMQRNESEQSQKVEIALPNGIVVRLDDCSVAFLSSVINALEKR